MNLKGHEKIFVESFTKDCQNTFMDDWKRSIGEVFDQNQQSFSPQSIFYPALSNEADHMRQNPLTMHEWSYHNQFSFRQKDNQYRSEGFQQPSQKTLSSSSDRLSPIPNFNNDSINQSIQMI